ncbi:MAG TPA: hypothetical protein VHB01_12100 [Nitrosospira sp.]|jgi:hypothetical protein|nr:hypothetical protein [Nitrosospira sp.]
MNHSYPSSISGNEAVCSSRVVIKSASSLLSLMLLLFVLDTANAQNNPMDSPPIGGADKGQYKSGKTPSGQRYGIIKEGEPHKNKDMKNKPGYSDEKRDAGREGKPNIIERDPSHPHEGSGPDPFGRY